MTTLLEAQTALQHAKPNEVTVVHATNGDWHIEIKPNHTQNKWAKFANEIQQKSPLRGQSEQVNALIKQFRRESTLK
jgi:hypothetical protein